MLAVNSAEARDAHYHLHPYTNLRTLEQEGALVVERGEGVYVYDIHGKKYLEGMAGLWCAALGFSEPRLAEAAYKQMKILPFYHSFSAKVPSVTVDLAEKLISIAPAPLARVIFANSGSEANDSAIKFVWYYQNARGKPEKKKIIARKRGYHGVTIMAGSLTGLAYAQVGFDLPVQRVLHTDTPHHYHGAQPGESEEEFATRLADNLDILIRQEGPETVAAFIAEPVMGAGGVVVPPKTYFEKIQAVLKKHDVLMIADEVICGFGRTGNMFGSETFGIRPDLMTVAKQLSSAYQPISAVLVSDAVYQGIADAGPKLGSFGHGYTYSGHPVAAAVALETLKIYEERRIVDHVREVGPYLQNRLRAFADHPLVGEVRGVGLIAAVELVKDKVTREAFATKAGIGTHLVGRAQEHGVILRAVAGDSIAFSPPLVITKPEIDEMVDTFAKSLDETEQHIRTL
jgi:4-aminobutyrate--pyruvate transaminase